MSSKAPLLVVMDGMSYAFRSFYAVPDMTSPQGDPVNALFGFIRAIKRAEKEFKPDYAVVAFDSPGGSFRDEMLKEYKANREAPPEPLVRQFPLMEEVVPLLGWHLVRKKRFEADDIMATLVAQARKKGMRVVLMTADKDMLQLVGEGVDVYRESPKGASLYGPKEVEARFGVRPDQICDLLGLMGDASDNIPGVPGIGEKTAAKLLQEYGSLEKVLKAAPKITQPKLSANLQAFADTARLSRKLAELDEKVDFDGGLAGMKHGALQPELADRFRDWGFRSYLSELGASSDKSGAAPAPQVSAPEKGGASKKLSKVDPKVFEASGDAKTALRQAGIKAGEACGVWQVGSLWALAQAKQALVFRAKHEIDGLNLVGLLSEPIFFESKPYLHARLNASLSLQLGVRDLSLAIYLVNSSRVARNLDEALAALEVESSPLPQVGQELFEPPALDLARLASALQLAWHEAEKRMKADGLWKLYAEIEEPLAGVLVEMEREGLGLDVKVLNELEKTSQREMKKLELKALESAGREFNLNSPSQLAKVLFEDLKLPHQRKIKTGYSTDNEVLETLAEHHELPVLILEYRQLAKLSGTYLKALPVLVDPKDGRLHTTWNQTVAATGRLSSTDPNLQNIPIRTQLGREIRRAFVPTRKNGLILAADYSQIELRVLAHYTQDVVLLKAFDDGLDIHRETAARIFNVLPEKVTSEMRSRAKVINFGVLYGMGPYRIAREFGVAFSEAKSFVEQYFARFPKVREFLEARKEEARETGFVTTLLGRRRYVPEARSANRVLREAGERIATNLPIQGTAADLIKLAMLAVQRRLHEKHSKSRLILQVHDELVIDLAQEDKHWLPDELRKIMKNAMKLRCPLEVSVGMGPNWYDAKA